MFQKCIKAMQSDELKALGGLGTVAGSSVTSVENGYLVKVPLVIMDDKSFEEYCSQIGVVLNLDGAIVLNRIWDNINSNFRYKQYVPFVNESQNVISIQNRDNAENIIEKIECAPLPSTIIATEGIFSSGICPL